MLAHLLCDRHRWKRGDGEVRSYDLVKACKGRVNPDIILSNEVPHGRRAGRQGRMAVIRALRDVGFDLQKHVHMDIVQDIRDNASKVYHITKANSSIAIVEYGT